MKKLLLILGLMSSLTGVAVNKNDIIELFTSSGYEKTVQEAAAIEAANQLESQYNKLLNGEAPFGKHFCNP